MSKYVFVTGGVVSSLGKGITAASLGRLLINRGLHVTIQKLDPYINVDPGTMSPYQHGEVFVTEDGGETDLDIGHYERFLDINFHKNCNYTSGKIYSSIIAKERAGDYLGATIQVVPHVTNEIKTAMRSVAGDDIDVVIVEIGGTVGDMEGEPFLEAIRQFERELGYNNYVHIHTTLLPYLGAAGEIKTKPTQHSVKLLTSLGLMPDIIVCRSNADVELTDDLKNKIAMFCSLDSPKNVIHNPDCGSIYEVPNVLKEQHFDDVVLEKLQITAPEADMKAWNKMVETYENKNLPVVRVAIVGKYTMVPDAYISVTESIKHACIAHNVSPKVEIIDSELIEKDGAKKHLEGFDAIVVPGGFGSRGTEGKILTAKYCRENNIPYLGLCLGMQIAVIEFARNVAGLKDANSVELNETTPYPVINVMEDQKIITQKGGTMRLGEYTCRLIKGTKSARLYGKEEVKERHRHRYEFNNEYRELLEAKGLVVAGVNPKRNLVEIIELPDHPFYVAVQFHPEFKSRPYRPHPLFDGLISKAIELKK